MEKEKKNFQLLIFLLENYPYHSAIYIENLGLADLSLLGSKITSEKNFDKNNYKTIFFNLNFKNKKKVISFLNTPCLITKKIINKEKKNRGWFRTAKSADYILEHRKIRSTDIFDMNCIEWIIYAMTLGNLAIPYDILTAKQLLHWSKKNLQEITKDSNVKSLINFY